MISSCFYFFEYSGGIAGIYRSIFNFLRNLHPVFFSGWMNKFAFPPTLHKGSSLVSTIYFVFFMMAILMGVMWYLTVVFIGITLMISDVEHLLCTCLYLLCTKDLYIFLEKYLFPLPSFELNCFCRYWVVWVTHIVWIFNPCLIHVLQKFSFIL